MSEKKTINCVGTVTARRGCWSFLKGGFVLDEPLDYSLLFFQVIKDIKNQMDTGTNEESGYKMRWKQRNEIEKIEKARLLSDDSSVLQNSDERAVDLAITSASLQPFTDQEWSTNQQYIINTVSTRSPFPLRPLFDHWENEWLLVGKETCSHNPCSKHTGREAARSRNYSRASLKGFPIWICYSKDHSWEFALSGR